MQSGREAVELLISRDIAEAYEKARNIDQYNKDRKELDKRITEEANAILEKRGEKDSEKKEQTQVKDEAGKQTKLKVNDKEVQQRFAELESIFK